MSKIALLINDTSNAYHWGCFGTSSEICAQLEDRNYSVSRFGVVEVHGLKTPPRDGAQMADLGFQRAFLADNPTLARKLKEADIVVINGEGTLHGAGQPAFNLLYIALLAKREFNTPVHAINMSLFPSDSGSVDAAMDSFYATHLSLVDQIVLRESASFTIAKRLELKATLGFDCLPLFMKRRGHKPLPSQDRVLVLGGGLGIKPEAMFKIADRLSTSFPDYTLRYVTGAQAHPAVDDAPLLQSIDGLPNVEPCAAKSLEDWIETLNTASCLVSGRFHHTIAATFLNTPVVTFQAGTPKLAALTATLELEPPLSFRESGVLDMLEDRVSRALSADSPLISSETRDACHSRALQNFDGL